ncbi:hypothetical protein ACIBI0_38825 [Microbispora rosea]|uniref:hypothetical protein n=1 Tax=Microbispora rosea TaxID=58117 RepID=UPI0037959A29
MSRLKEAPTVRRSEAVALLAVALVLVISGVVWLAGPWGLVGAGVVLAALTLFAVNIREG